MATCVIQPMDMIKVRIQLGGVGTNPMAVGAHIIKSKLLHCWSRHTTKSHHAPVRQLTASEVSTRVSVRGFCVKSSTVSVDDAADGASKP